MLDDRQSQTGAAGRFAAALIHTVEALKHAGLCFFRNADAIVRHGQGTMAVPIAGSGDLHFSAGPVVADGIITQVLAQLIQQGTVAVYKSTFPQTGQRDISPAGIQLLTSLVAALPDIIVAVVEAIPQIIDGIITAVLDSIPLIIQAGIDLLISLVQALPEIITTIVAAIPEIIGSVVNALINSIPQIVQAGVELFISLIANLPTIIVEIVKAVPQILAGLVLSLIHI